MVGHLFGYEAALAIDASARPLREAREVDRAGASATAVDGDDVLAPVRAGHRPARRAVRRRPAQPACYDGHLEASAPPCGWSALLRDAARRSPARGVPGRARARSARRRARSTTSPPSLTRAIEELTRPVDAIKHQAKTVTVGISRSDEGVLDRAARAGRARRRRRARRAQLPHAEGARRPRPGRRRGHRLHPLPHRRRSAGDARSRSSTAAGSPASCRAASSATRSSSAPSAGSPAEREVLVARGRSDGRTVILVPEVKAGTCTGHHAAARALPRPPRRADDARRAAGLRPPLRPPRRLGDGDRGRVPTTDLLGELPVADLLIEPISDTADHWRSERDAGLR